MLMAVRARAHAHPRGYYQLRRWISLHGVILDPLRLFDHPLNLILFSLRLLCCAPSLKIPQKSKRYFVTASH